MLFNKTFIKKHNRILLIFFLIKLKKIKNALFALPLPLVAVLSCSSRRRSSPLVACCSVSSLLVERAGKEQQPKAKGKRETEQQATKGKTEEKQKRF